MPSVFNVCASLLGAFGCPKNSAVSVCAALRYAVGKGYYLRNSFVLIQNIHSAFRVGEFGAFGLSKHSAAPVWKFDYLFIQCLRSLSRSDFCNCAALFVLRVPIHRNALHCVSLFERVIS